MLYSRRLRKRLSQDYGFDVTLKYEDNDGDMITLASQNDLDELFDHFDDNQTVSVSVSETILPNVHGKRNSKSASLWTPGSSDWAKGSLTSEPSYQQTQNAPSPVTTPHFHSMRTGTGRFDRFPHIDSPRTTTTDKPTRWKKGEVLGQGAFGVVYLGLNVESGELMAVKQMTIDDISKKDMHAMENEISNAKSLRHPNIVRYIGTEVTSSTLSIFMEYVPGGSLKSLIDKFGKLEESVVRSYTRQLLLGLEYLHRNGIAHRDVKGANCLVGNDGAIKLADFGASRQWRPLVDASGAAMPTQGGDKSNDVKGTPAWMAPEVIRNDEKHLNWKKADVWALGCTTIEMTTGRTPWAQFSNPVTVLYHIACSDTLPEYPEDPSVELLTFLNACLQRDPQQRPDITSLLLHPFVANIGHLAAWSGGGNMSGGGWSNRPSTVSTTPGGEWAGGEATSQWKLSTATSSSRSLLTSAATADLSSSRTASPLVTLQPVPTTHDRCVPPPEGPTPAPRRKSRHGGMLNVAPSTDMGNLDVEATLSNAVLDSAMGGARSRQEDVTEANVTDEKILRQSLGMGCVDNLCVENLSLEASLEASIEASEASLEGSTNTLESGHDTPKGSLKIMQAATLRNQECSSQGANSRAKLGTLQGYCFGEELISKSPIDRISNSAFVASHMGNHIISPKATYGKHMESPDSHLLLSAQDEKLYSIATDENADIEGEDYDPGGEADAETASSTPTAVKKIIQLVKDQTPGNNTATGMGKKSVGALVRGSARGSAKTPDARSLRVSKTKTLGSQTEAPPLSRGTPTGDNAIAVEVSPTKFGGIGHVVRPASHNPPQASLRKSVLANSRGIPPASAKSSDTKQSPQSIHKISGRAIHKYSTTPGGAADCETPPMTQSNPSENSSLSRGRADAKNRSWKSDASGMEQVEDHTEQDMTSLFTRSNSAESEDEIYEELDTTLDEVEVSEGSHVAELSDDPDVMARTGSKTVRTDSDDDDSPQYGRGDWLASRDQSHLRVGVGGCESPLSSTHSSRNRKQRLSRTMMSSPSMPSMSTAGLEVSTGSGTAMDGYALVGHSINATGAITPKRDSRPSQMSKQGNTVSKSGSARQLLHRGGGSGATSAQSVSAFRRHHLEVSGDSIDLRGSAPIPTTTTKPRKVADDDGSTASVGDMSMPTAAYGSHESDDDNNSDNSLFKAPSLTSEPATLEEHTAAVSKLRLVIRRKLLISSSMDGTVRIWSSECDTSSRAVLECNHFSRVSGSSSASRTSAKTGESTPRTVRVSAMWTDDACDAVWGGCSDGGVRVWNGGDGKPMRLMKGHEEGVTCMEGAESVASAMAVPHMTATGSLDKTVRVWDLRSKRPQVCTFRGHGDSVLSLKWVEGGRTVVSASKDRSVKIWDTRTGR